MDDEFWDLEAEYEARLAAARENSETARLVNSKNNDENELNETGPQHLYDAAGAKQQQPQFSSGRFQQTKQRGRGGGAGGGDSRGRGGNNSGGGGGNFKTLDMKPGQRLRVRPQPRRSRA